MRQKNIHGYPLAVPSLGRNVDEGEIIDCDILLAGFEPVDGEQSDDTGDESKAQGGAPLGSFPGKGMFPGDPRATDPAQPTGDPALAAPVDGTKPQEVSE